MEVRYHQCLLILAFITFSQELPYINASYALIGVRFPIFHRLARPGLIGSRGLAYFGFGIGAAWVLAPILALIEGWLTFGDGSTSDFSGTSLVTFVGLMLFFLGYLLEPVWAIWLGARPPRAGWSRKAP